MLAIHSLKRATTSLAKASSLWTTHYLHCLPGCSSCTTCKETTEQLRKRPGRPSVVLDECSIVPLPTRHSICLAHVRTYSTKAAPSKEPENDSIFSPSSSPWDRIFEDINDSPPLLPSSARSRSFPQTQGSGSKQRHTMTARETAIFEEMYDMIFDSFDGDNAPAPGTKTVKTVGIGRASSPENDLFGKLHRQSKGFKRVSKVDEELDKKREAMDLCKTDQQLLEWAMTEVFDESRRYEANARRALEEPASAQGPIQLQSPSYPHVLALLIRTFRDKYADPHLALSIFDHARHLSIPSYVLGCTTPAYNELIETRWRCFRDLRGVCDALDEMRANGVKMDNGTRHLAEIIRREVGERNLWQEESQMGSGEVWNMVARIEQLTARSPPKRPKQESGGAPLKRRAWTSDQETWKRDALQGGDKSDGWEFGQWDDPKQDRRHVSEA